MKHHLNQVNKEKLLSAISQYFDSAHPNIAFVYVFGSFIKEKSFADIDLGICLFNDPDNALETELNLEFEIEKRVQYPIDARILNGAPNTFVYNVIRTGKLIVDRDPDYRADFNGQMLKAYFDFACFRRRYLKDIAQ